MASGVIKSVKSKYKHVLGITTNTSDKVKWRIHIKGVGCNLFETEKQAALAVDKYLISIGKEPVNVLVRREVRDWEEDFAHENGNYQNRCSKCGELFIGHKRRPLCKICA